LTLLLIVASCRFGITIRHSGEAIEIKERDSSIPDPGILWRSLAIETINGTTLSSLELNHRLEAILAANPHDADALGTHGWLLVERGYALQGITEIRRGVDIAPQDWGLHLLLSLALHHSGNIEEAQAEMVQALMIMPQLAVHLPERDKGVARDELIQDALQRLCKGNDCEKDFLMLARKGELLYFLGQYSTSEEILNSVLSELPTLAVPWHFKALIALKQDRIADGTLFERRAAILGYATFDSSSDPRWSNVAAHYRLHLPTSLPSLPPQDLVSETERVSILSVTSEKNGSVNRP